MVIIKLTNDVDWFRANWIYRQLVEDTMEKYPHDEELKQLLKMGGAIGTLFVNELHEPVHSRILKALKTVAEGTIAGDIRGWDLKGAGDESGRRMYIEALTELLSLIDRRL